MNALAKIKETRANLRLVSDTKKDVKQVSMDNGFIQIPRDLMLAIMKFGFTNHQRCVIDAVIVKVLGYHKEIDWVSNPQIVDLTTIGFDNKASTAKQQLIKMNVLVQKGKMIGFNYNLSEWKKGDLPKQSNIDRNSQKTLTDLVNGDLPKQSTTKETITKQKINNTPLTPQGDISSVEKSDSSVDEKILADAKTLLAYYNELAKSTCRDAKPFVPLLTKTKTREAYSLEDIKLVLKWVLGKWERKNGSAAKPKNICRIERFDGYLSDAMAWQKNQSLYQGVIDAYNEILGDRLVPMNELDTLAEKQIQGLLPHLKNPSVDAFVAYFETFAENAKPFYFEPERKFGFSFLMKPETLVKTRRQEL